MKIILKEIHMYANDNSQVIDKSEFESLVNDHKQRFNGAFASITYGALGKDSIFFNSTIFDEESWSGRIMHNDPMKSHIMIEKVGDDSYIATSNGTSLLIKPRPEDKYLAYSRVKCTFRKTKGDAKKIINAILKWQEKRLELVKEYKSEIKYIEDSNLSDL